MELREVMTPNPTVCSADTERGAGGGDDARPGHR